MICNIENEKLTVQIESLGAELKSIRDKETGREYMWSGDKAYWGKTSPILFPFVGALKDGAYTYQGKTYPMSRHGFAREMEFHQEQMAATSAVYVLEDTKETLEKYPFHFRFEIEYRLEDKSLEVIWRVYNRDTKEMYFSLGGHPAFACPPEAGKKRTDCFIQFDTKEELIASELDMKTGLLTGRNDTFTLDNGYLKITEDLFDKDALIIENHQCHEVALCNKNKEPYVKVNFNAPLFGVWSVPDHNASYVCIEPWYGRCDRADFAGTLKDREWSNTLKAGEVFEKNYVISIL